MLRTCRIARPHLNIPLAWTLKFSGSAFLLVTSAYLRFLATASSQRFCALRNVTQLTLFNGTALNANACYYWTLDQSVIDEATSAAGSDRIPHLVFEFWRLYDNNSLDTRRLPSVHFLVARGAQPIVTHYNDGTIGFTAGTLLDASAFSRARPYHRIVVPVNVTPAGPDSFWYATVANMAFRPGLIEQYAIMVTLAEEEEQALCPRPTPWEQECSGRGTCGQPPVWASLPFPELNKVCYCDDGWGDIDCYTPVGSLESGSNVSAVIQPGDWADWQISVPLYYIDRNPSLLVELVREPAQELYGGDPLLVLMPKSANGSNQLPWINSDSYVDWPSKDKKQKFHYLFLRRLENGTLPRDMKNRAVLPQSAEYYVAVYNNRSALKPAKVTLRVRWLTDNNVIDERPMGIAGNRTRQALCPGDCFGRGTCYDPQDVRNLDVVRAPVWELNAPLSWDFQCACQLGFGGPMCEGTFRNVSIPTSSNSYWEGTLQPGQWTWFILNVDPQRFDFSNNSAVFLDWNVTDSLPSTDDSPAKNNAIMVIVTNAFPRASMARPPPFGSRGWQITFSNDFRNIALMGGVMRKGYVYVVGLYNTDYERERAYDWTLNIYSATRIRTWLHPYMSVVLGVTAAVVLCLLMTLCRRLILRYGWGPFRARRWEGQEHGPPGVGNRIQAVQPRLAGVPQATIATFHTYTYAGTRAQKAQMAVTRRDSARKNSQTGSAGMAGLALGGHAVGAGGGAGGLEGVGAAGGDVNVEAEVVETDHEKGPAGPAGEEDDSEPQCTVCLCEYEEGERITQLSCRHEFHSTCINKWLKTHSTCPVCRVSLLPPDVDPSAASSSRGSGRPPPTPPPHEAPGTGGSSSLPLIPEERQLPAGGTDTSTGATTSAAAAPPSLSPPSSPTPAARTAAVLLRLPSPTAEAGGSAGGVDGSAAAATRSAAGGGGDGPGRSSIATTRGSPIARSSNRSDTSRRTSTRSSQPAADAGPRSQQAPSGGGLVTRMLGSLIRSPRSGQVQQPQPLPQHHHHHNQLLHNHQHHHRQHQQQQQQQHRQQGRETASGQQTITSMLEMQPQQENREVHTHPTPDAGGAGGVRQDTRGVAESAIWQELQPEAPLEGSKRSLRDVLASTPTGTIPAQRGGPVTSFTEYHTVISASGGLRISTGGGSGSPVLAARSPSSPMRLLPGGRVSPAPLTLVTDANNNEVVRVETSLPGDLGSGSQHAKWERGMAEGAGCMSEEGCEGGQTSPGRGGRPAPSWSGERGGADSPCEQR